MKATQRWAPGVVIVIAFLLWLSSVRLSYATEGWLPISPEDLALKDNPKQPGADAMIPYREDAIDALRSATYGDSVEEYIRIKIFTQEGTKYAHVEIPFVKENQTIPVVNDPKLGSLLIFDPTNEHVPLGYLPWYLQENYGLLIAPDGEVLISLPLLPSATNRLLRTAKFDLSPTGDLSGEVKELEWGGPAAQERAEFLTAQPSKRVEIFDHFLGYSLNNFTLTDASLGNLENYDENLLLDYKFVSPGYANAAGDLLFVRPRVIGDKSAGMLRLFTEQKPRRYPVEFEEATRQDDVFDITLPAGYVVDGLPQPAQADCDYATYHSEIKVADGVLHYKRSFEIKDVIVPTEKLPQIRSFLQQVAADEESAAVFRRTAPNAAPGKNR